MQSIHLDSEYNGSLNRAVSQGKGAAFALLLAMLEQDQLDRPRLTEKSIEQNVSSDLPGKAPEVPLKAEPQHWQFEVQHAQYIHQLQLASARLWHCMHPTPLSVFNDAKRLDDDTIANSSWSSREKLKGAYQQSLEVDETGLLEVIEQAQRYQAA